MLPRVPTADEIRSRIRDGLSGVVTENVPNMQAWIDGVAREDQAAAVDLLTELARFPVSEFQALGIDLRDSDRRKLRRITVANIAAAAQAGATPETPPPWAGLI